MIDNNPYASIHYGEYPMVWITFTGESPTRENFEAYLEMLTQAYEKQANLALIFDARRARFPRLRYQLRQAQWLQENDATIRKYCQGTAYLIKQPLIRAALKMIFAWQKNPVPFAVMAQPQEARRWALGQLDSP